MHWRPAHENHAIERVVLTLQFSEQIPQKAFVPLLAEASLHLSTSGFEVAPESLQVTLQSFSNLQIDGAQRIGGIVQAPPIKQVLGRSFRIAAEGSIREEVSVQRGYFSYSVTSYERWAHFRDRAFHNLEQALTSALAVADVAITKLEYWDRFVCDLPTTEVDYTELIRRDSQLVANFGLDAEDLWHSHIGYFTRGSCGEKRLINFNVDVLDLAEETSNGQVETLQTVRRSVGFYSLAQDTLSSAPNVPSLRSNIDEMHAVLNELLAGVITTEAAERISLNTDPRS